MKNNLMRGAAMGILCLALGGVGAQAMDKAAADKEIAAANAIANQPGEDLHVLTLLCHPQKDQGAQGASMPDPVPTKVFDNVYFVGRASVSAWAIKTSDGIILIDSLDNPAEADVFILDGLRKLGLDPMQVKYDIVTHGHGDHYGGAHELQQKIPGMHVLMSATDYDMADKAAAGPRGRGVLAPTRDMVVTDGEKLTLGDETLTLYLTPGHTPGTVSLIIPVTDHGKAYTMGFFGGSTFPLNKDTIAVFGASLKRFRAIMAADHVVGRMSNHPIWDNSVPKINAIRANPDAPSAYLETPADFDRYTQIQDHCMNAQLDLLP